MVTTRCKKSQQPSTDRQKWEIIFRALKQLLRKQQTQIDSLLQERNLNQQRLQMHNDNWNSDVILFQDQIFQLRQQLELSKLANVLEVAKGELLVGSQKRNASLYKHKLEHTRSDLDDFKAWFDILSHKCPDNESISLDWLYEVLRAQGGKDHPSKKASEQDYKILENEVANLKREYEKLSVKNSSQVSALQSEIKFVWNQYNTMEGNHAKQIQTKNLELNEANEKITKLLARLEQVQSSNSKKDQMVGTLRTSINRLEDEARQNAETISRLSKELDLIKSKSNGGMPILKRCSGETSTSRFKGCSIEPSTSSLTRRRKAMNDDCPDSEKESSSGELEARVASLRAEINKLEADASQKNGEIFKLSNELNLLKSKTVDNTPVLGRCTSEPSSSRIRTKGNASTRDTLVPKEEDKGRGRRSKRKQDNVVNIEDTPKLFTSQFKIPKLRSRSPGRR